MIQFISAQRQTCTRQSQTALGAAGDSDMQPVKTHVAGFSFIMALTVSAVPVALAEPVKFDALVAHRETIRLDFADPSKHFLLLVRREGKSEGQGPLAGAAVQEFGSHDIVPGVGGEARGYLEFIKPDRDKAYIKWTIQAVFVPGPDGKPKLLDNGVWQVVGATGKLEKLKGAGAFRLIPMGSTERRFALEGELVQ
ncbi:MAG TPA: hypothetical protein VF342_09610 [Alphaproteobacteria bacterium]